MFTLPLTHVCVLLQVFQLMNTIHIRFDNCIFSRVQHPTPPEHHHLRDGRARAPTPGGDDRSPCRTYQDRATERVADQRVTLRSGLASNTVKVKQAIYSSSPQLIYSLIHHFKPFTPTIGLSDKSNQLNVQ